MSISSLLGKTVKLVQHTVQKARTRTISPSADEARIQREVNYQKGLQDKMRARKRRTL